MLKLSLSLPFGLIAIATFSALSTIGLLFHQPSAPASDASVESPLSLPKGSADLHHSLATEKEVVSRLRSLSARTALQEGEGAESITSDVIHSLTYNQFIFRVMLVIGVLIAIGFEINRRNRFFSICSDACTIPYKIWKSLQVRKFKKPKARTEPLSWHGPTASFQKGEKIIWGHWNTGEDTMPAFNKLAVSSWRLRNPNCKVIILDNYNYKKYVSPDDLPSTFEDLLPQHQSDILRMAVLIRYGGIYIDVSTLVFKSLEDLFESMPPNTLGIVPMYSWKSPQGEPRTLYNNYVLVAPYPNTTAVVAWREKTIQYMEDPATSIEELDSKPLLQRIRPSMTCEGIGMMGIQAPYLAMCWLLTDLAWNEPHLNILELPFSSFGLGTPIIHDYTKQWKALQPVASTSRSFVPAPAPSSQPLSFILGMGWTMCRHAHLLDASFVEESVKEFTMLKFSIHFHAYNRIEKNSTVDYYQRAVCDPKLLPTVQADLDRTRLCSSIFGKNKDAASS